MAWKNWLSGLGWCSEPVSQSWIFRDSRFTENSVRTEVGRQPRIKSIVFNAEDAEPRRDRMVADKRNSPPRKEREHPGFPFPLKARTGNDLHENDDH